MPDPVKSIPLLSKATAVSTGRTITEAPKQKTFDAVVQGTGAVTATVVFEGSNNGFAGNVGTLLATLNLSGTTSAADGIYHDAPWSAVRARVTAISGAGAVVDAAMGV